MTDYCRALYDYDATGSDEITFEEGDIIRVLKREPNGVDDGWWMGELRTGAHAGANGLFPSIVVEECYENGEDSPDDYSLASPQSSVAPPSFSPPPRVPSAMIPSDSKQVNLSPFYFSFLNVQHCHKSLNLATISFQETTNDYLNSSINSLLINGSYKQDKGLPV